jgi:hypothetical protein
MSARKPRGKKIKLIAADKLLPSFHFEDDNDELDYEKDRDYLSEETGDEKQAAEELQFCRERSPEDARAKAHARETHGSLLQVPKLGPAVKEKNNPQNKPEREKPDVAEYQ